MTHSQEIALRCAAALPVHLLAHRQMNPLRITLQQFLPLKRIGNARMRQLEACSDDEARRILTGKSR